jgi:geranylgeranyl pyrophosphate synthase
MIHTYSLIHDDLPAMDDDDLRRGKATCHIQFGEATAILAGDVLQTLAFKAIADDETLTAETRVKLISMLADASGTPSGMVSGQQLDLDAEGKSLSIEEIEEIHGQKTGALISAAAKAGAIIGGASNDELTAIENYAAKLGLLFQITDDLLDVTQASETLGKTAGKDAAAEKATYPGLYGVEKTWATANTVRDEACDALSLIKKESPLLVELADLILSRTR